ncbi:outer-membrane receptor for ferric coprogen and ferric-rhodotorulic acid [Pseudoalteromonas ulvae UL12]|uniref:TonB-dependent siderophore receptor n=1 Tax=Pseudoalteromonas ulvae TaxID=107327 RepID=UPI00186B7177|nr:TonB-dependent siderophore receptor [Pseudoalteromonas ulvae]MBE0365613.1 outer-membrane receptor for ferric coprogen and ferric-rhodotorulic acid [Pseudoalteromonas ulvae UL12]
MTRRTFKLSALFAATSAIISGHVFADDGKKDIEKIQVLGDKHSNYLAVEAETASKLGISIKETPQSVRVVTRALMDDFSLDDVNQVLETTPGVSVEKIETDRTYYKARGFDILNFQVDGLGLPQERGVLQGTLDTAIYQRIEVAMGANGMMTGAGNPSATVNFIRKRPTTDLRADVSVTAGSWSNKRIEADVSGSFNDVVSSRIVAVKQKRESYLDRYAVDRDVFYGIVELALTDTTTLTSSLTYQSNDSDSPLWGALALFDNKGQPTNYDVSTSTAADWAYWNNTSKQAFVELEQLIGDNWSILARYAHTQNEQDSNLFYVYGTPDAETGLGLTGYASDYQLRDRVNLLDVYARGSFELFGQTHLVALGASEADMYYFDRSLYDYQTGNGFPAMPNLNEWDGAAPVPTLVDVNPNAPGSDVHSEQSSQYVSARFSITDELKLLGGLRYTNWQTKGLSYGNDKGREQSNTSAHFGLVYTVNDDINVYSSYSDTFAPQSEKDISGAQLAPIEGDTQELGVKAELFDSSLMLNVALFNAEQVNIAVGDAANSTPDQTVHKAAPGIQSKGYEIELSGDLGYGFSANLGFTHTNIDVSDTVNAGNIQAQLVKDYTPKQVFKLAVKHEVEAIEGLSFGLNMRWQDDISRIQNPQPLVVTKQDAYAIVNMMASYDINEKVNLTFNVNNVFDQQYLNSLYWAQGYYGAPRNFAMTLNWSL